MVVSHHHINISPPRQKTVSQFWSKSQGKNRKSFLNPFTKERRDLIFWGNGVIFRGEFAGSAQKFTAPPENTIFDSTLTFCSKHFIKKSFWASNIKCQESSETRFGKVWRLYGPSLMGKLRENFAIESSPRPCQLFSVDVTL